MSKRIKIFLSYKDKHKIIKSDIIQPVQTGAELAQEDFAGMLKDNTGENISKDNPRYNELSAQYWVWKNYEKLGNPDYVGFMHYRRHFIFDESLDTSELLPWHNGMKVHRKKFFDQDCQNNLKSENIEKIIDKNYDCYAIYPYNINFYQENDLYIKEHYLSTIFGSKRIVWNIFENTVKELYPQLSDLMDELKYGNKMNCCNMFIMKKHLFFEYSQILFNILQTVDEKVDSKKFNKQELRFLGYLGEYILTLYIKKLAQDEKIKIKYLHAYLIENIDGKNQSENIHFIEQIFSIRNEGNHKVVRVLGIKIKFPKNKKPTNKTQELLYQTLAMLRQQQYQIKVLNNKISDLQEEILIAKTKQN